MIPIINKSINYELICTKFINLSLFHTLSYTHTHTHTHTHMMALSFFILLFSSLTVTFSSLLFFFCFTLCVFSLFQFLFPSNLIILSFFLSSFLPSFLPSFLSSFYLSNALYYYDNGIFFYFSVRKSFYVIHTQHTLQMLNMKSL